MYIDIINKFFPELEIKDTRLITNGWESDILIVNNDKVFRFPKANGRFDCVYEKEKIITDYIRPFISINISNIQIYKDDKNIFSVLDLILEKDLNNTTGNIVDDFAKFLKELHSVDVKPLKKYNLNAENLAFYKYRLDLNNFSFNYDVLPDILKKYNLEEDFNNNLRIFANFNYKDEDDVLCHNDLHKGNIIINEGKLSGIIDFGDTIYTNYNIEFVSIFKWKEEEVIVNITKKYEEITGRKLNIDFIIAISKLSVYSKISYNTKEIEKYLEQLKFYDFVKNKLYQ